MHRTFYTLLIAVCIVMSLGVVSAQDIPEPACPTLGDLPTRLASGMCMKYPRERSAGSANVTRTPLFMTNNASRRPRHS